MQWCIMLVHKISKYYIVMVLFESFTKKFSGHITLRIMLPFDKTINQIPQN